MEFFTTKRTKRTKRIKRKVNFGCRMRNGIFNEIITTKRIKRTKHTKRTKRKVNFGCRMSVRAA